jgi:hypothetical protein
MEKLEIWKSVNEYEGIYEVSNLGNVKRNDKTLKPWINNSGYYSVSLSKNGIRKVRTVHQLESESFLNFIQCGYKLVINHIDFNRLNNHLENLEIVTQRENANKKHIKSSSQLVGVSFIKSLKKWRGQIVIGTTVKYLGVFDSEIEASEYYQNALISLKNGSKIIIKKPKVTSEYKGVSWNKNTNKWRACIRINNKQIHLGLFNTELQASENYKEQLLKNKNYES